MGQEDNELVPIQQREHVNGSNGNSSSSLTARNSEYQSEPHPLHRHSGARRKLGLNPKTPLDEEHAAGEHSKLLWPRIRAILREFLAEFWAVFFMVMFGNGSVAQVLLSEGSTGAPGGDGFGNYQSINWGWGLGVMLGIYIGGEYVQSTNKITHSARLCHAPYVY